MKKALGILFAALLIFTAFVGNDYAQARDGRNAALLGGLAVGAVAGAAIADSNRHNYNNCDAWGNCYERSYYRSGPRGLVWNDDKDCYVSRRNFWGPCRAY